jgi:hypothetical protein
MQPTRQMQRAGKDLLRRYLAERSDLHQDGSYEPLQGTVKLDRFTFTANAVPLAELGKIPEFQVGRTKRLWRQLYQTAARIRGAGSIRELIIEFTPQVGWLPKFRVAVIPRDETGLLLEDLSLVLELIPQYKIVLLEVALDFPLRSVMDTSFVRQHMLCGKTWMRVGGTALHERWGSSRSAKVVRAYAKFEILRFRIELQLHARFLRKYQINYASDFQKLATILPRHHIYFAAIDHGKLREQLQRSGLPHKTKTEILKTVTTNQKSLWSTLRLLRRKWHFVNARRLLAPLTEMNALVVAALNEWATQWQTHSPLRAVDKTNEQQTQ